MNNINAHKVGLVYAGLLAIWHATWATMVLIGVAKPFMDWILSLHFLKFEYAVNSFDALTALTLIVVTGIIGYVVGYLCGVLWNFVHVASHKK